MTNGTDIVTYAYDQRNRLTQETDNGIITTYSYDNNGNLTAESDGTQYTYDAFNRIVETNQPDGTWQENIYDAVGLRMATLENGSYTEYTFDRGSIIADFDKNEDRTTRYIRGFDLISQEDEEGVVNYYLHNAHGDIIKLVDKTGNVQNSYSYDAFGNITAYTEKVENRFRYAGEQYDTVTGEIYLRARYYEPEMGRFVTEDTYRGRVNNPQSLNLYTYCINNPVRYIDPSGHRYDDDITNRTYNNSTKCEDGKGTGKNKNTESNHVVNNGYELKAARSEDFINTPNYPYISSNLGLVLGFDEYITGGLIKGGLNLFNGLTGKQKITQDVIDYNIEHTYEFRDKYKAGQGAGFSILLASFVGVVTKAIFTEGESQTDVIAKNRAQGKAFEQQEFSNFSKNKSNAVEQVTIKTTSGTKTRVDAIGLGGYQIPSGTEVKIIRPYVK